MKFRSRLKFLIWANFQPHETTRTPSTGWRWLCKLGWHAWEFVGIDVIPTGAWVQCRRCRKNEYHSWVA